MSVRCSILVSVVLFLFPCLSLAFVSYGRTRLIHDSSVLAAKALDLAQYGWPLWSMKESSLTVVIPAYNEEERIIPTLRTYSNYLKRWNATILVVDDGSTDDTVHAITSVAKVAAADCKISCLSLECNQGKGNALAAGISACKSTLVLTADADGSADIECLDRMHDAMQALLENSETVTVGMVCGYRTDDESDGRSIFRQIFSWGFRKTVLVLCGDLRVRDSQCGFKLMTATTANILYNSLNLPGWSHDVEVLYRAKLLNIPISEAPVLWEDKVGSKLSDEGVIKVAAQMGLDVIRLRILYGMWLWKVPK